MFTTIATNLTTGHSDPVAIEGQLHIIVAGTIPTGGQVWLSASPDNGTSWSRLPGSVLSAAGMFYVSTGASSLVRAECNGVAGLNVSVVAGVVLPVTSTGGGGGGTTVDRELVVVTYTVSSAFTGASIGDIVTCTQVIDVTNTPTTVLSLWRNQTTLTDLGVAPNPANLALVGTTALTAAQRLSQDPATSAKQDTGNTSLASLDGKVATAAKQDTGNTSLASIDGKVATAAKQDTGNTSLASIDGKLTGAATAANQATGNTSLASMDGKLGTSVAQDATVAATNTSLGTDGTSPPALPGSATGVRGWLRGIYERLPLFGSAGTASANVLSIQGISNMVALIVSGGAAAGVAPANPPVSVSGIDAGGLKRHLLVGTDGTVQTNVTGSVLPTGAATSSAQATANTSLSAIVTNTGNIPAKGAAVIANSTPVNIASDQTVPVAPVGQGVMATATVPRAANTTVYTAGDVVGGPLTIANAGASGGNTVFNSVALLQNLTAVPSGQTSFRLYLYNATPPSAIADNSPFTLGSGDRAAYLGYIDIGTPALVGTGTGTPYAQAPVGQIGFKLAGGSTSLFGYLVTNGGFTPAANSETYTLWLNGVQA